MAALYQGSQWRQAAESQSYCLLGIRQPDDHLALHFGRLTKQSDDSDERTEYRETSLAGFGMGPASQNASASAPLLSDRHTVQSAANKGYPQA